MAGRDRVGCFPGSFGPLTVAHLAVAEAALTAGRLDRVDLVLSIDALGRTAGELPAVDERADVLRSVAAGHGRLGVRVSGQRLVADLAEGYDAVVLGADKWRQVLDPEWYGGDVAARDLAVGRLPLVLVAPRADDDAEALRAVSASVGAVRARVEVLAVDEAHRPVSATEVRGGGPEATAWIADDPAVRAAAARWFPTTPHPL